MIQTELKMVLTALVRDNNVHMHNEKSKYAARVHRTG